MAFVYLVCKSKNHDCYHQTMVEEYRKYLAEKEMKNEDSEF